MAHTTRKRMKQAQEVFRQFDTPEQFADYCFPAGDTQPVRKFFDDIGWPEGYVYCCQSREYAIKTGFRCVQITFENEAFFRSTYPS